MIILGTNSIKDTGYNVDNSARFDGTTAYLNRTPSSASNRKTFTFSTWIKRSGIAGVTVHQDIFSSDAGDDESYIHFDTDSLKIFSTLPSSAGASAGDPACVLITTQKFRDFSAWMHIVVAVDTTQGTASNRVKLYINGTQVTSFSTETYPDQNYQFATNAAVAHMIARRPAGGKFLPGYLAETVLVDGSQLAPDQFGEFDSDSNIWKPIDVSGLTFGTNGFYLDFEDSGALGDDVSGNGNDFTVNNLTAIDQTTDTCTNNFATMNPLDNFYAGATFSEGNLKFVHGSSPWTYNTATFGLSSGLWYWEMKCITANQPTIGIANRGSTATGNYLGQNAYAWSYRSVQQNVISNGSQVVGSMSTFTDGDIISVYLDLTANKLYFAKNGTLENSGTGISLTAPASTTHGVYFPAAGDNTSGGSTTWEANFGNPSFTGTDKADANGYGSFEYDPSVGTFDGASKDFYALCTKNLAEYG